MQIKTINNVKCWFLVGTWYFAVLKNSLYMIAYRQLTQVIIPISGGDAFRLTPGESRRFSGSGFCSRSFHLSPLLTLLSHSVCLLHLASGCISSARRVLLVSRMRKSTLQAVSDLCCFFVEKTPFLLMSAFFSSFLSRNGVCCFSFKLISFPKSHNGGFQYCILPENP